MVEGIGVGEFELERKRRVACMSMYNFEKKRREENKYWRVILPPGNGESDRGCIFIVVFGIGREMQMMMMLMKLYHT